MPTIDFRNNYNWTTTIVDPTPSVSQKPKKYAAEELAALIRQQSFVNSVKNSPGVIVQLATPEEVEQAQAQLEANRPVSSSIYYTRVLDDNLAVRKDKLSTHAADELNQRTSMVSASGSYSKDELVAMMNATAEQQPDISSIVDLMQPLQNGELNSSFSSRVNIGLPNQREKVVSMDTLEAVYGMSYRAGRSDINQIYQANMSLTLITEDNTEITISAELMNKLALNKDYISIDLFDNKTNILVGASRDLNLSFSANQELTDKDKELMNNIGSVAGNLLNGFYQNLAVDNADTQALLSLQNNSVKAVDLKLSTDGKAFYFLPDAYRESTDDRIYFNLNKAEGGAIESKNNIHKLNVQAIEVMQNASKHFI